MNNNKQVPFVATKIQQIIDAYKIFVVKTKDFKIKNKEVNGEKITQEDIRIHNLYIQVRDYFVNQINNYQIKKDKLFDVLEEHIFDEIKSQLDIVFTDEQKEDLYSLCFSSTAALFGVFETEEMQRVEILSILNKKKAELNEEIAEVKKTLIELPEGLSEQDTIAYNFDEKVKIDKIIELESKIKDLDKSIFSARQVEEEGH